MNISLNNYEAFFLDYHEGKLTPGQVGELMSFLEEHPQLKEMFYEFENLSLTELEGTGLDITFDEKSSLKKEVLITRHEIDDLLAGAVEGVLDTSQQRMLDELLINDPGVKDDLDLYNRTVITPDISEVFEAKEELKRYVLISSENCLEYFSASIDNELNPLEQKELERFLLAHPEMERELEALRKTKLTPDLTIVYENKEELKRKSRPAMSWWYIPAMAAGIALVIGLYFLFSKPAEEGAVIVKNDDAGEVKREMVSPVEKVKKEAIRSTQDIAATEASAPRRGSKRNGILDSPKDNEELVNVPLQDDLRDLQAPVVTNNILLPKDTIPSEAIASNDNINERIEGEDEEGDLAKPVTTGYNSLRDIAVGTLKTGLMKEEADLNAGSTRISKWDIVSLALRGFRKITGRSTEMNKVYDEEGEVIAYNISLGGLEFSRNK